MPRWTNALLGQLLAGCLSAGIVGAQPASASPTRDTLRVLFVGNSFTYFHNMPAMLESISSALPGPVIRTSLIAHGGWRLSDHWDDTATRAAIRRGGWNWMVFNEQSMLGETYVVDGKLRIHSASAFAINASRFAEEVRRAGAQMALIGHWSNRDAEVRDGVALDFAFDSVARALGARLIPASAAWRDEDIRRSTVKLYASDDHHPSEAGSYLLANLTYTALTGLNSSGAPPAIRGSLIEDRTGEVHRDSTVQLVALGPADAALVQRVVARTWSRAQAAGGFLPAHRPDPVPLPAMPATHAPLSKQDVVGTWRGSTTAYMEQAVLELKIRLVNDTLRGVLHRELTAIEGGTDDVPVTVTVDAGVVTITDAKGPSPTRGAKPSIVVYKGALNEGQLKGVVRFIFPSSDIFVIGRWQMRRL